MPAIAGAQTAELFGYISDPSNQPVNAAVVRLQNDSRGQTSTVRTDRSGRYVFVNISPGVYSLSAEASGLAPQTTQAFNIAVGDRTQIDLRLELQGVNEVVQVAADARRSDGAVGTIVGRQFVERLPLNGRSFLPLIALTPGVTLTAATFGNEGQFSVNGQRPDSNYLMVDGVSGNIGISAGAGLNASAGGALAGVSANGSMTSLISLDAMEEFRIDTSGFAPEFGRTPGGQVAIVSRSGANRLTGSAFEYVRNESLDANDWFANSRSQGKPELSQHDFGGVLGGPITQNRAFFFASTEHLRLTLPRSGLDNVPSVRVRETAPAALAPYLNAFPLPTGPELANGLAEYAYAVSDESSLDSVSGRVDLNAAGSRFFVRAAHAPSEVNEKILVTDRFTRTKTTTVTGGATSIIAGASVEVRGNVSEQEAENSLAFSDRDGGRPPSVSEIMPAGITLDDAIFGFTVPGRGYNVGKNVRNRQRQINLTANASANFGKHLLKAGVDWRQLTPHSGPRSYQEALSFTTLADVLAGRVSRLTVSTIGPSSFVINNVGTFIQDHWSLSPSTSVTYGVRWDIEPSPGPDDTNPALAAVNFGDLRRIDVASPGTSLWKTRYSNVAPRLGVSHRLDSEGRTTLRGGVGIFYDLVSKSTGALLGIGYPFTVQRVTTNVQFPMQASLLAPPVIDPSIKPYTGIISLIDPEVEAPMTTQWNVSADHQLPGSNTLSLSYVGARGRRLLRIERFVSPNPNMSDLRLSVNADRSQYRSLQASLRNRATRGMQILAGYTWGDSRDTGSSMIFAPALSALGEDREFAASSYDIRHTISAAVTADLESWLGHLGTGFAVDVIWRSRSAPVVNVTTGVDSLGLGSTEAVRPNLVPGVPLYIDDSLAPGGRRINRAAFEAPGAGQQGTLPRNALRGLWAHQLDLAVSRRVRLAGPFTVTLKAECFNLLNTPNFASPVGSLSNANFGAPTQMLNRQLGQAGTGGGFDALYQMGGPRSIQLSVRGTF